MVTPNATIVYVNNISYPDIFFGLKGGFNNFGIVTKFSMRALPQTQIYGGSLFYGPSEISSGIQAVINLQANYTDPKAQTIGTFIIGPGSYALSYLVFYDAPTAPNGTFDGFTNIKHTGGLETQSLLTLVRSAPTSASANLRLVTVIHIYSVCFERDPLRS